MKKLLIIGSFCILGVFVVSSSALADGKFYVREQVPPDIPYQRAIISYADGEELLILQSKFEGEGKDFGWVIPVPTQPKLGSIKTGDEERFLVSLDIATMPDVTKISEIVFLLFVSVMSILFILLIVERISCAVRHTPVPKFFQGSIELILLLVLIFIVTAGITTPNLLSSRLGVEVLSQQQVGIYDTRIIKASDAREMINWLNEYNYKFTSQDEAVFKTYIQKDWCFMTARINAEELKKGEYHSSEGLVNPLVLVFKYKETVYPLALTATVGTKTEILIYIVGAHRMVADNRFELEGVGELSTWANIPGWEALKTESTDNLSDYLKKFPQNWVTKFRGRLSSEQMKEDLILKQAPDDKPFRKHIWRW